MSESVPLLSIPPQPACPRCGVRHLLIPLVADDVFDVTAADFADSMDAFLLDMLTKGRAV